MALEIDIANIQLAPSTKEIFTGLKKDQLEEFFNYAGLPYPGERTKIDVQISALDDAFEKLWNSKISWKI